MTEAVRSQVAASWAAATVPGRCLANAAYVAARCGYRSRTWLGRAGLDVKALEQTGSRGITAQSALIGIPEQAFEWLQRPRTIGAFTRYEF